MIDVKTDNFPPPIILIGAARSGTKFLRDCLAASPDCVAVPYDINYIWRYGQASLEHDILDPKKVSQKTRSFIQKSIRKISGAQKSDKIIEKTVSNTLRIPYVNEIYPDAVYVHLIRDGRAVTESSMRQWINPPDTKALLTKLRTMPIQNIGYVFWYLGNILSGLFKGGRKGGNVWGPRYSQIMHDSQTNSLAEVCAKQWKECIEKSLADLVIIDEKRVHTIRYEDLVLGRDSITELAKKLELSNPEACADAMVKNLRVSTCAPAWTKLSKENIDKINSVLSDTLMELGYE